MSNNNGRVNLNIPESENIFKLYDKMPVKVNSFYEAMNGNLYNTKLSNAYFSKENMQIIQNALRKGVYKKSNNAFIIAEQDYEALSIIMRSIFLQHSKNLPENITEQIQELNNKVLEYAIPQVFGEIQGYMKYKKDVSTLVTPLENPINDKPFHKHLEFKPRF